MNATVPAHVPMPKCTVIEGERRRTKKKMKIKTAHNNITVVVFLFVNFSYRRRHFLFFSAFNHNDSNINSLLHLSPNLPPISHIFRKYNEQTEKKRDTIHMRQRLPFM